MRISLLLLLGIFSCAALFAQTVPPPPPPVTVASGHEELFKIVETMPRFPIGDIPCGSSEKEQNMCAQQALLEYVYDNVAYPDEARKKTTQGMAVVSFIVERNGQITEPKIYRDPGDGMGKEAVRVVQQMINEGIVWAPGIQRGQSVRVEFKLPIKFVL